MAKLLTQRASFELMDACLQIHGGAGYMKRSGSSAPRATLAWARSVVARTRSCARSSGALA